MKTLIKVIFSILITFALILLLEAIAWFQLRHDLYQGDVGYFWKLKSNLSQTVQTPQRFLLQTNSEGYRSNERIQDRQTILLLGCSTTLGWGVDYEESFVFLLEQEFSDWQIINGGQPGWSSNQIVLNLDEFSQWAPDVVLLGAGVRDAQLALREDTVARPTPWLLKRYSVRWLKSVLVEKPTSDGTSADTVRVPPSSFHTNLQRIKQAFPKANVYFYMFPQISMSSEHQVVLQSFPFISFEPLKESAYFANDPVHLNQNGHKEFADQFIEQLSPILSQ